MEVNKHGKRQSIIFWGSSLVGMIILGLFLANLVGFPVGKTIQEWANTIPIVNRIIPDPASQQATTTGSQSDWKQKYLTSSAEVKDRDQKIADLNKQLTDTQKGLEDMKKTNQDLQQQLDTKQTKLAQDQTKQIADMYANIPATKAAAMIASMPLEDASLTISQLKQDQQSSILGSMKDAKKAAQITLLVKDIAGLTETDPAILKDQIHQIALQQENPTQTLADTLAGMPPTQSAGIIQSMMGSNAQSAMDLLKNVNTSSRAQILTEIQKTDANMAAQIAASLNK